MQDDKPFLLSEMPINTDRGEVALLEEAIELLRTAAALDEDDDLVVGQLIEKVVEASVLLLLLAADVELLETVKR